MLIPPNGTEPYFCIACGTELSLHTSLYSVTYRYVPIPKSCFFALRHHPF